MTLAVILALALQGAPEVTATVDRTRLRVGEELLLTVRVRTHSAEGVRVEIPPPVGFALIGTRAFTEVSLPPEGGTLRVTVRELRLRAERAGRSQIAHIRVVHGRRTVTVDPVTVDVAAGADAALSALARGMIERAPPPLESDAVQMTLVASADSVYPAEQVDLLAVAWFPRDVRLRLRRPPVVALRTPDGVWAQATLASADIAASRQVRGAWFDVFVSHQVVFPLQPGRFVVEPAAVDFALPVSYSFFSREDRYSVRSDSLVVVVMPLPDAGRPTDDRGVVARDLTLTLRVVPPEARVGEPLDIEASLAGVGNVALWSEPEWRWPRGLRVYPAETMVEIEPAGGPVAGRKTFHYLVVPDSAGAFVLPDLRYHYFDPGAGAYRVARTATQAVPVAAGAEPRAARPLPPLAPARAPGVVMRAARRVDRWGWLALFGVLPLVALAARRRRRLHAGSPHAAASADGLPGLEGRFLAVLASHVPDAVLRDGPGLAQALRAAGIESAVADHVMRLRDRLRGARYGPRGTGNAIDAGAEIRDVLRFLDAEPVRRHRRRVVLGLLLLALGPARMPAQAVSAEALYEAGALRAAADSFAARAARHPRVAAHWYNLGATLYRAGSDGKATVAWTRAARLAPRDELVRRALRLLPADAASEPLLDVGLATPEEWAAVGLAAWLALWVAVLLRRRAAVLIPLAALAVAAALPGGLEWRRRAHAIGVVLASGTTVRGAPYGGAAVFGSLPAGAAVVLGRHHGAWVEVRRDDGVHGWLLDDEVAAL